MLLKQKDQKIKDEKNAKAEHTALAFLNENQKNQGTSKKRAIAIRNCFK